MYKIIMTNPAANDLTNAVLYIADELDNRVSFIRYPICPAGSL